MIRDKDVMLSYTTVSKTYTFKPGGYPIALIINPLNYGTIMPIVLV
jgi:hypothetical protein